MRLLAFALSLLVIILGASLVIAQGRSNGSSLDNARSGDFTTVDQARRAAGFDIPQLSNDDWLLRDAMVNAVGALSPTGSSHISAVRIDLKYEMDAGTPGSAPAFTLKVLKTTLAPELTPIDNAGDVQRIKVQGNDAFLQTQGPSSTRADLGTAYVQWRSKGLLLTAFAFLRSDFSVDDLLKLLETIS